jgi:RND superfamily putative drug exporter
MGFASIGQTLVRRRRVVLVMTVLFVALAGAYGADVAGRLSAGGFNDPQAESARAERYLSDTMGSGLPNLVLLVQPARPPAGAGPEAGPAVDDPELVAAGEAITARLAATPGIVGAASYWTLGRPAPLRSTAGDSALVVAHVPGDQNHINAVTAGIVERVNPPPERRGADGPPGTGEPVARVRLGGLAAGYHEASTIIERDLRTAELLALPVTLIVLVLVFRSVVAALTPVLGGIFAIVGALAALKAVAGVTEVSVFALNLTTALGLGLAIDYSLFVLSRYREERQRGLEPHDAVVRTVATAGRSVVFSGLTVAVSLAALLLFPMAFLRSFAYAGIPVVALAVVAAVLALPALLAVLGDRIDALAVFRRRSAPPPPERSFWYRTAMRVMRRPLVVAGLTTAALLALAVPVTHLTPGLPDDRVMPADAATRQVGDALRSGYSSRESGSLAVVLPGPAIAEAELDRYAAALSRIGHVGRVDARTGVYLAGQRVLPPGPVTARFTTTGGEWLSVVPAVDGLSPEGEALTATLRATPPPAPAATALVAGPAAEMVDSRDAVVHRLPWALAVVGGATFVLLFLSFGSLLVPVKALALNTLSLTATFGAMVWIFQDGHLADRLGFTPTGMLDLTVPILVFCVAFGLSMDYEVFLLSRIKEEYDRSGDNRRAVALGLTRSARIITAAAATFSVVLLAFSTSSISFVKLFGIALATAVLVDATVIRALMVPAFMRLAGDANWWAPAWLRAVQRRVDLGEHDTPARRPPAPAPVPAAAVDHPSCGPVIGDRRGEPVEVGR